MELLTKLGIDWRLLIAQIVNFLVLMAVLYKFLYKPVLKMLDDRKEKIDASLKQTEQIQKNLFESEGRKEKILQEARNEAGRIIAETKEMSLKLREELTNKSKMEAAAILEHGKEQLENEKKIIFREIKSETAGYIADAVEKILKGKVDATENKKIIERNI